MGLSTYEIDVFLKVTFVYVIFPTVTNNSYSYSCLLGYMSILELTVREPATLYMYILFIVPLPTLFGNDNSKSKIESGGNYEETEFW
jgi:hypothetical protein